MPSVSHGLNSARDVELRFVKPTAAFGGRVREWPRVDPRRGRDRQNTGHNLSDCPHDRARHRAGKHPRGDVHEQSRPRDERAGRQSEVGGPRQPADDLHLPLALRSDSTGAYRKAGLQTQFCHSRRIRTAQHDQENPRADLGERRKSGAGRDPGPGNKGRNIRPCG